MSWRPLSSAPGPPGGPTDPASRLPASNITPEKKIEDRDCQGTRQKNRQNNWLIQPFSKNESNFNCDIINLEA